MTSRKLALAERFTSVSLTAFGTQAFFRFIKILSGYRNCKVKQSFSIINIIMVQYAVHYEQIEAKLRIDLVRI